MSDNLVGVRGGNMASEPYIQALRFQVELGFILTEVSGRALVLHLPSFRVTNNLQLQSSWYGEYAPVTNPTDTGFKVSVGLKP